MEQEGEVCLPAMSLQERRQLRRVRLHRRRGVALAEGGGGPRREDVVRQHAAEHLRVHAVDRVAHLVRVRVRARARVRVRVRVRVRHTAIAPKVSPW